MTNDAGYLTSIGSINLSSLAVSSGTSSQVVAFNGTNWAAKDETRQFSYVLADTTNDLTATTGSVTGVTKNLVGAATITSVYCETDQASASTFNISIGGSNVFASAQNCTSSGTTLTSFAASSFALNAGVNPTLATAATDTKRVNKHLDKMPDKLR